MEGSFFFAESMSIAERQEKLLSELEVLPTAEDKLSWLVERGERVPRVRPEEKNEAHQVKGCQSPVWLAGEVTADQRVFWRIETPSAMVRGLLGVLWELLEGATGEEISRTEIDFWSRSGLDKVLSPTRRQGLAAVQQRIKEIAVKEVSRE